MKRSTFAFAVLILIVGCTSTPTSVPPTATAPLPTSTPVPPTSTPLPTVTTTPLPATATAILIPTSTPTQTSPTPRPTMVADEWLGREAEREKLFGEYVQTIKDAQVISELGFRRISTTWERELQRSKKRFIEANTKTDVYYALLSLQRSFHDAHSWLSVPTTLIPQSSPVSLPFVLEVRGHSPQSAKYIVVQSSIPELKAGFVLKRYQNKSIEQLEYEYLEWLDSTSPEKLKMEVARELTRHTSARRYPAPDINTPVTVVFSDPTNQREISLTVQWQRGMTTDVPSKDYDHLGLDYTGINYRIYKDTANQTIVLVYSAFNYNLRDDELKNILSQVSFIVPSFDRTKPLAEQTEWIVKFVEANGYSHLARIQNYPLSALLFDVDILNLGKYLNQQTVPNLLMDVRNNGGGSFKPDLIALFATQRFHITTRQFVYVPLIKRDNVFLQEALTLADSHMRRIISDQMSREKDATTSPQFPFFCRTANCLIEEAVYDPNTNVKKFNFAVLSGPGCVSACDQFVAVVKDNKIGAVVGLPSCGATAPMRAKKDFHLKNGERFSMVFNTSINYRSNGEPLEGNPAQVDYYLYPEDNYINKIIKHLRETQFFR